MKIGIVGYQGSGKSALFEWLTGALGMPRHLNDVVNKVAQLKHIEADDLVYTAGHATLHSSSGPDTSTCGTGREPGYQPRALSSTRPAQSAMKGRICANKAWPSLVRSLLLSIGRVQSIADPSPSRIWALSAVVATDGLNTPSRPTHHTMMPLRC